MVGSARFDLMDVVGRRIENVGDEPSKWVDGVCIDS